MNATYIKPQARSIASRRPSSGQRRTRHHIKLWSLVVFLLLGSAIFGSMPGHASTTGSEIKAGRQSYCLDDHTDKIIPDNAVDAWGCNESSAQDWTVTSTTIKHDNTYCLSVENNATTQGTPIVLNTCDGASGQVWLRDRNGYQNPNSGMCLASPEDESATQLVTASCSNLSSQQETWTPTDPDSTDTPTSVNCQGAEGDRVACYAANEWTTWQSASSNHEELLNAYTDGAAYEKWCADFVSYVYKEAGYPFTQGEADGWDESNANNVQNMGFIEHDAGSGYIPKAGDVAFFDYSGGHVEIVVAGGKTPTFVYGDSATIDPTTGNGDMKANTITNDGTTGQVIYYLSPR